MAERCRRGKAVHARHLDVEQRDVGGVLACRGYDLIAAPDLGDDLEVVLEVDLRRAMESAVLGFVVKDASTSSTPSGSG